MTNAAFHAIRQYALRLLGGARKGIHEAAAWRRWGGTALFLLLMPVCALAQNNPYKIDDRLYREAGRLGDKKARCLALTVPMLYYFDLTGGDNEAAFLRAVDALQKESVSSGYRQYYYYGLSNRVNYLVNRNRYREALNVAQEFEKKARRENDAYGVFYGLNSIGLVHFTRNEIGTAIRTLNEALEVGRKYLPDQDMGTVYRKLSESYYIAFDFLKAYDAAQRGYDASRTKPMKMRLVYQMAQAQTELHNYDKVAELYDLYVKLGGRKPKVGDKSTEDIEMLAFYDIATGKYDEAEHLLQGMDSLFVARRTRLEMALLHRTERWKELAALQQKFYGIRIASQDSMDIQDMVSLNTDFYNQRMLIDRRRLMMERLRAASEHQLTEIHNSNLELANTQLLLRHSSLELERTRNDADRLSLANDNKRLETAKLKSRIKAAQTERAAFQAHAGTAIAVVAVLITAALMYVRVHRRVTLRLNRIHSRLSANNEELKEAHRRAVAADNVKTTLIQNMTRNIDTHLHHITEYAALVTSRKTMHTSEERAEYFRQIRENTDRMLAIVKDVLEKAQK